MKNEADEGKMEVHQINQEYDSLYFKLVTKRKEEQDDLGDSSRLRAEPTWQVYFLANGPNRRPKASPMYFKILGPDLYAYKDERF